MLKRFPVTAILPASDVERARAWWEERVGMEPDEQEGPSYWYNCANGRFALVPSEFAGTAKNTAMSFTVEDIGAVMSALRERGVKFEEYDLPTIKTSEGLLSMGPYRAAWFRDTEGNIVELTEVVAT